MGGSVAVDRIQARKASFFVDDKVLKGELIMKQSSTARVQFVEYIKEGAWAENLTLLEDMLSSKSSHEGSVWEIYGYKEPQCQSPSRSFYSRQGRSASERSSDISCVETDSSAGLIYQKKVLDEFYSTIVACSLFKTDELRTVLFASLFPIYSNSPVSKTNTEWMVRSDTSVTSDLDCVPTDSKLPNRKRTERLQSWLLGAAAMCDSTQLEACLADPNRSWVTEYQKAIKNLPVTIYVSVVDTAKQESKIVFCSVGRKVGANLHDIFSAECSTHDIQAVHRAVFGAKKHKHCVLMSSDYCKLRTVKPVYCEKGQLKYMLGIESQPFQNVKPCPSEEPFHQVEDLLALLPLLIKFPL